MPERYNRQVGLLVQCLPLLRYAHTFGLKGGTAINLFLSEQPLRLSVDIDLQYLDPAHRDESFPAMNAEPEAVERRLSNDIGASVQRKSSEAGLVTRLSVRKDGTQIKLESSPVLRGVLLDTRTQAVADWVVDRFGYAECRLLAPAEILAGKVIAALDRQHPRDLYDVDRWLHGDLQGGAETLDEHGEFRAEFVDIVCVYLASSARPIEELLEPRWPERSEWEDTYRTAFSGMELGPDRVEPAAILACGHELVARLVRGLEARHARFLQSITAGSPALDTLQFGEAVGKLPAIRWRVENVAKLQREQPKKHKAICDRLDEVLDGLCTLSSRYRET